MNLVVGRFPTRERTEQIPIPQELIKEILPIGDFHLEEERRLFYVGMTRAKDFLLLTASNFYGEGKREKKISPFVSETLGEETIEKIKPTAKSAIQTSLLEWEQPVISSEKLQKSKLQVSNGVTYLSYSQIQTFDICPMHYKLRYMLKIPVPQTSAQSFGTSVHAALRDYYQNWIFGNKPKIEDVSKFLEKEWINEGYASKAHEKSAFVKAQKIAIAYLKNNFDKTRLPLALELPFQFVIKNLKIGGRIDRVDKIDNQKIEIIDYKTGDNVPDEKKLAKDLQLTFYALAATEVHDAILNKKPDEVLLSLYYLEREKKLTTTRTKEQLEEAKKMILEKAEEISKSEFLCSGSALCKNCEYKILCGVK